MHDQHVALVEYLRPLQSYLDDSAVNEILINQCGALYIERRGQFETVACPEMTWRRLTGLAALIANASGQVNDAKRPLLSAQLPSGHRVQVVLPPATLPGRLIICIRNQTIQDLTLDDYVGFGAFARTRPCYLPSARGPQGAENCPQALALFEAGNYAGFLMAAVKAHKNVLVAGATSTGKTTFLNACLQAVPAYEHIITLEDVQELRPPQEKHTALLASKGNQGVANCTMQDLVQASLRLRPDRLILGELRGAEAADFINASATGHDGSISSLHAGSPALAFMRLTHMVMLNGTPLSREDILQDLYSIIDVVVQLRRHVDEKGRATREVAEIYYVHAKPFKGK